MMTPLRIVCVLALAALAACTKNTDSAPQPAAESNLVATSFHPIHFVAERLIGPDAEVVMITPPGVDPLGWKPQRDIVSDVLLKARHIVVNGADAESWLNTVELPRSRLIDTNAPFADRLLEFTYAHTHEEEDGHVHDENCDHPSHSHGDGAHEHTSKDPHTWVDPLWLLDQAREMAKAFEATWPDKKAAIGERLLALEKDLKALDERFAALVPKLKEHTLFGNHGAWNYLAKRHGISIETHAAETDREVPLDTLDHLLSHKKPNTPALMFWEKAPLEATLKELTARGITSVVFDPAEDPATGQNYITTMNANLDRLAQAVNGKP